MPGRGADVRGLDRVSADGSHVAFLAGGVLTSHPDESTGEAAAPGADNLYVYDAAPSGSEPSLRFVARLCSGLERSGSVVDPACPAGQDDATQGNSFIFLNHENPTNAPAKFTPDGRYLLFASHGRLTADDTDGAADVYRYDYATGRLHRLSFGRDGNDGNGNDSSYPAELNNTADGVGVANADAEDSERSISADGFRAIFETAAPLVSSDTNRARDVYEWEEQGHGSCHQDESGSGGCLRLLSDGLDPHGTQNAVLSASGRDVVFQTQRGEVPADTDGVGDIYDAREGGGFPYVPPSRIPCQEGSPERCHGESTKEELHINPVTESNESGGNGHHRLPCGKGRHRVTRHGQERCVPNHHKRHKHKRRHHKQAASHKRGGRK